jgi:hypothetical protein
MPLASDVGVLLIFRLVCYLLPLAAGAFAVLEVCRTKRETVKKVWRCMQLEDEPVVW